MSAWNFCFLLFLKAESHDIALVVRGQDSTASATQVTGLRVCVTTDDIRNFLNHV